MPAFLSGSELSRCDLRLSLRNSEGYLHDACVRYTVFSWDGVPVSGRSLKAVKRSVGEYYAPWRAEVGNGSYRIVWEVSDGCCGSSQEFVESFFVVDPSDYVCSPGGSMRESAVPPQGSGTFLNGSWLGPGDLPLFLKDSSGLPFDPYAVFWTIFDSSGRTVAPRSPGSRAAVGEYYAQWVVSSQSGGFYVQWEWVETADGPATAARMDFTVICPSSPLTQSFCWADETTVCSECDCRCSCSTSSTLCPTSM